MSDIAEGFGGAIEGALTGRAVEREVGSAGAAQSAGQSAGAGGDHAGQQTCRNCGAQVTTAFCPECGQRRHVHRTLSAVLHDLIHGVLHLDGKFWLTLPLLVFKPGQLTRRYIEGERAKFVSPMAMFLFSVFAMFAIFQMVGLTTPAELNGNAVGEQIETTRETVLADLEAAQERLTRAREGTAEYDAAQTDVKAAQQGLAGLERASILDLQSNPEVKIFGIDALDQGIVKKWRDNPTLMLYKLQANAYKFSWLLIPLSIPFVWLMFAWRRRFHAYDHAIFVTYSLAFMSMLFITASLLALIPDIGGIVALMVFLVPPIHLYAQLRGAYELSHFSAFWRLMVLSVNIWIVVLLFLQALLLLGAF